MKLCTMGRGRDTFQAPPPKLATQNGLKAHGSVMPFLRTRILISCLGFLRGCFTVDLRLDTFTALVVEKLSGSIVITETLGRIPSFPKSCYSGFYGGGPTCESIYEAVCPFPRCATPSWFCDESVSPRRAFVLRITSLTLNSTYVLHLGNKSTISACKIQIVG